MTGSAKRLARPLVLAIALVVLHAVAGETLATREPLAAVLEGQLGMALVVLGLLSARLTLTFVVVPWTLVVALDSALEALSAHRIRGRGRLSEGPPDAPDGQ